MIETLTQFTGIVSGLLLVLGILIWPLSIILKKEFGKPLHALLNERLGATLLAISEKDMRIKSAHSLSSLMERLYTPRDSSFVAFLWFTAKVFVSSFLIFVLICSIAIVPSAWGIFTGPAGLISLMGMSIMAAFMNCFSSVIPDLAAFPLVSRVLKASINKGALFLVLVAVGSILIFFLAGLASAFLMEVRLINWEINGGGVRDPEMAEIQKTLAFLTSFFPLIWVVLFLLARSLDMLSSLLKLGIDRAAATVLLLLYPLYTLIFLFGIYLAGLTAWFAFSA